MSITDIGEARRRRAQIREAAQWALDHLPWTSTIFAPEFMTRWPDLTTSERSRVAVEMEKLGTALDQSQSQFDLDEIGARLSGDPELVSRAAEWLLGNVPDVAHPEFVRLFGYITRSEIVLAIIERGRRLQTEEARHRGQ
jgi:hypothetical protein